MSVAVIDGAVIEIGPAGVRRPADVGQRGIGMLARDSSANCVGLLFERGFDLGRQLQQMQRAVWQLFATSASRSARASGAFAGRLDDQVRVRAAEAKRADARDARAAWRAATARARSESPAACRPA